MDSSAAPVEVDPNRGDEWAGLLGEHPFHTVFDTPAWARVMRESYGYKPRYLFRSVGGRASGLAVMEIDSWLTGCRGVSLPFSDECLPLVRDPMQARQLLEQAIQMGRARGWRYFEAQGGELIPEAAGSSVCYFGHAIELQRPLDAIFASLDARTRSAVRKAERDGVQVEVGASIQMVRAYYDLQCLTRRRHGLPPQPWTFFERIHRYLVNQDMGFVVLARHSSCSGGPVAGAVFLHSRYEAIYKYAASDVNYQSLRANNSVLWKGIERLVEMGKSRLSLGRSSTGNAGLRGFKAGWGSAEYKVWHLKFDYRQNRFVRSDDETSGWHNVVFRNMPGFMSRLAGSVLYRHWG